MSKEPASKHHLEVLPSSCAPVFLSSTDTMAVPCSRAGITEGASLGGARAGELSCHARDMPKPSAGDAPSLETWL